MSKVDKKYPGSGALCDNFEKLQECQAQRARVRVNVAWGYFTETAPHIVWHEMRYAATTTQAQFTFSGARFGR